MQIEKLVSIRGRNVLVAIPTIDGKIDVRIAAALMEAKMMFAAHGANLGLAWLPHCSSVSKARNALATQFMKMDEVWSDFFFVDADTVFRAEDMVRIVARTSDVFPVIAGAVPIKAAEEGKFVYKLTLATGVPPEDGLLKLHRVGTAFMNIRRSVLDELIKSKWAGQYEIAETGEKHWCFFREHMMDGQYWGEDYTFCNTLPAIGVSLWLDPACVFSHVKTLDITGCFASDIKAVTNDQDR